MRRPRTRPGRPPRVVVVGSGPLAEAIAARLERSRTALVERALDRPADALVLCDDEETAPAFAERVKRLAGLAARICPGTAIIVASPRGLPLCREAARASGLPAWLILCTGGVPRAAAEAAHLAARLDVSPSQVTVPVIGGDPEGPAAGLQAVTRLAVVSGIPARELHQARAIEPPPRESSPAQQAAAAAALACAVIRDTRAVFCCGGWVEGRFGLPGGFVTLPYPVGARGVEPPLAIPLNLEERALLQRLAVTL